MKKLLLGLAAFILFAIVYETVFPEPDDSANRQVAIALIQKSYGASPQLLSWNPDLSHASWVATKWGKYLCESRSVNDDCYEVEVWVDVIPNGETKRITARWFTYDGNTKYQAENAEARTLFVPAAPIPSSNNAFPNISSPETVHPTVSGTIPLFTSELTAISHTAEAITGDIGYSTDNTMTILNKSYPSTLVHVLQGKDVEDAARMFSISAPAADSSSLRALYRINIPAEEKLLNGNTICGTANARWVVYLSDDENLDIWNVAFFSGDTEPNLESEANLCGTFRYQLPAR